MPQTLTLEMIYEDVEFTVLIGETLALRYSDENDSHTIYFADNEQMEAVAKAMLKVVKFHKEN